MWFILPGDDCCIARPGPQGPFHLGGRCIGIPLLYIVAFSPPPSSPHSSPSSRLPFLRSELITAVFFSHGHLFSSPFVVIMGSAVHFCGDEASFQAEVGNRGMILLLLVADFSL